MKRAAIILTLVLASPILAEGTAEEGGEIAREYCVRCHDVSRDGAMKEHPPAFAAIAKFRSEEQIRSRIWFPSIHSGMPNFGIYLNSGSVDALTAYITSLE
ncbi:c-type cytochrome [Ruegeria arenilitoris]|uniref:c-type cytochrome n=1 Tax=Ruegeria arenilitoris TaxID=1173585 RepID=UPI00147C4216|nr:cytochrome c [Ruegeria arenilitoris]